MLFPASSFPLVFLVCATVLCISALIISFKKRRFWQVEDSEKWLEPLLLALGVALRVAIWATKGFWHDLFAIKAGLLEHSFWQLITVGPEFEQSAPLGFMLVMKAIGICSGWTNYVLTFPILICGIWTLFLFRELLIKLHIHYARFPFLAIAAIHPSLVWFSTDFKSYELDAMFATCFAILVAEGPSRKTLLRLAFLSTIGPFFSMGSFFVIATSFVCLFLSRARIDVRTCCNARKGVYSAARTFAPFAIVAALFCGISFLHVTSTMPTVMDIHWSSGYAPLPFSQKGLLWHWIHFARLFKSPVYFLHMPYFPSALQVLFVAVNVFLLLLGLFSPTTKQARWMVINAFLLWLLCLTASHFGKWSIMVGYPGTARLLCFLIPSFTCSLALGVERCLVWTNTNKIRNFAVCGLFLLTICSILPQLNRHVIRHYCGGRLNYEADNVKLTPVVKALGPRDIVVTESWAPNCFIHSIPRDPETRIILFSGKLPSFPENGGCLFLAENSNRYLENHPSVVSLRRLAETAFSPPEFKWNEIEGNWFSIIRISHPNCQCESRQLDKRSKALLLNQDP